MITTYIFSCMFAYGWHNARVGLHWYLTIDCIVVSIIGVVYLYYDIIRRPVVIHVIY